MFNLQSSHKTFKLAISSTVLGWLTCLLPLFTGFLYPLLAMEPQQHPTFPITKIQKAHRIALYTGAFDPLHNGHNEVMECSLKEHNLDLLLVSPDPEENNYKPYLTNRDLRFQMLKKTYDTHPHIHPCLMDPEYIVEAILKINPNIQIFGIVGSDNILLKMNKQRLFHNPLGHEKIFSYLVHVRLSDEINFSEASRYFQKKVIPLSTIVQHPNLSSTKLKAMILGARDGKKSLKLLDLAIPQSIQNSLTLFNPYANIPNPPNKFTLLEVKTAICEVLNCDLPTIQPLQKGLSGDHLYFISKNGENFVAKTFMGLNRDTELKNMLEIPHLVEGLNLTSLKFVEPLFNFKKEAFSTTIMPYISGTTILDHLTSQHYSLDTAPKIGQALAEFNTKKAIPCSEVGKAKITQYYEHILIYLEKSRDQLPSRKLDENTLRTKIDDAYREFLKAPGYTGYTHGDASPTNLIMTEDALYFLDYGSFSKSIDPQGNPCGFPARDLCQFISGVYFHLHNKNRVFDEDLVRQFCDTLKSSYLNHASLFVTPESINFFETYYFIKSITI